jgi:hypothetical protein
MGAVARARPGSSILLSARQAGLLDLVHEPPELATTPLTVAPVSLATSHDLHPTAGR